MQGMSWTLLAPFKEQRFHRSPSESIANNYTPTAADLKVRELLKRPSWKSIPSQRSPRKLRGTITINKKAYIRLFMTFLNFSVDDYATSSPAKQVKLDPKSPRSA